MLRPKTKRIVERSSPEYVSSEEDSVKEEVKTSKSTKINNDNDDEDFEPSIEVLAEVTDNFNKTFE